MLVSKKLMDWAYQLL